MQLSRKHGPCSSGDVRGHCQFSGFEGQACGLQAEQIPVLEAESAALLACRRCAAAGAAAAGAVAASGAAAAAAGCRA